MIERTIDRNHCCGCSACASVCPQGCISMVFDAEGFIYPSVDTTKCVNCNLCDKVCPALTSRQDAEPKGTFAAHFVDDSIVKSSSSGGIFTVLAQYVISKRGVVYGAHYDDKMNVVYSCAYTNENVAKFRGSKYVQARINDCYQDVAQKLKQGVIVLFTGTPCQIAGLKTFLRKPYDNLFTMEVVCHGVPSEKVWHKHLQVIKEKYFAGFDISNVIFRYKENDWRSYKLRYVSCNNNVYDTPRGEDAFFLGFVKCLYSRPSCEKCQFKNGVSGADLTVGDLWGVEMILGNRGNLLGESLVIVNTDRGLKWLRQNADLLSMTEINFADAMPYNEGLHEMAVPHRNRASFFQNVDAGVDVDVLINEMLESNTTERLKESKNKIINLLSRIKNKVVNTIN